MESTLNSQDAERTIVVGLQLSAAWESAPVRKTVAKNPRPPTGVPDSELFHLRLRVMENLLMEGLILSSKPAESRIKVLAAISEAMVLARLVAEENYEKSGDFTKALNSASAWLKESAKKYKEESDGD